ncbi:MAG: bifunctional phosphoglucose/phosphomannose isomerase [Armatimonadetes bacterium]|nr:bifunctional phosphoglucose/phosphomannose isomerase [Armatimonadota bacterium]
MAMELAAQLNSREFVLRNDPKGMYALFADFPNQVRKATEIALNSDLPADSENPGLVVLTGLGGSAAGGDFVKALFEESGSVPFLVNRDYHLPAYAGAANNTLVFACSYSGNTEETLSAYADAKGKGAKIICVTSGGKLAELAQADGNTVILIPAGQPPRTALGWMLMPVIIACSSMGLLPKQNVEALAKHLETRIQEWTIEVPHDSNEAKQLAVQLYGKFGVLYGLGGWQGLVANRWKGQINENSKNLVLNNTFPELNHNEILGWVQADRQSVGAYTGILIEDGTESNKMKKRFAVTASIVEKICPFTTVQAKGNSLLERMLDAAVLGDFVSIYLAALNDVDPENIDAINVLKSELSKVQ